MRVLLAVLLFVSIAFSEFLETDSILGNSNRLQINDTLVTQVKPTSSSPITIACFDSGSNVVRECSLSVISVGYVDSAAGADRLDGMHKSYYDTVGDGRTFCDTPYVPYALTDTSYSKTIMKQRTNYLEIEALDTDYVALEMPDNYYQSMAADTAGYIYTIHYFGTPELLRMTGEVGVHDDFTIKSRTWSEIYCDPSTNILYATATYSLGNQGLYIWDADSVDFIFYDSVYYGASSRTFNGITINESGDIFVSAFDNYIYEQTSGSGPFSPYADRRYWTSVTNIGDTIWAFTSNAGVYMKTPLGSSFASYDATVRGYGQSWTDSSGNIYVLCASAPSGVYRRAYGTTTFELYHAYSLTSVLGGTYLNGSNYICDNVAAGDVYKYDADYSYTVNRFTVNGSQTINGVLSLPMNIGTKPIDLYSTVMNDNLNADLLDGYHSTNFLFSGSVDSGTIPVSDGDQLNNSSATDTGNTFRIREDLYLDSSLTVDGFVGLGITPSADDLFLAYYDPLNTTNANLFSCQYYPSCTSTGSYVYYGFNFNCKQTVGTGATNSGFYAAMNAVAYKNGAGTLSWLLGNQINYGMYTDGAGTVTNAIGNYLRLRCNAGVITNGYDLYIAAPGLVGGTVTNEWAIYSLHDAPSSFIGNMHIDADDRYIKFGEAQDATIGYESDGDLHYNSQAVGSGNHVFEGGEIETDSIKVGSSGTSFTELKMYDGTNDTLFISAGGKTWTFLPIADQ